MFVYNIIFITLKDKDIFMKKLIFTLFLVLFCAPIYASNFSFLNYSPAFYFTKQDWEISKATAIKALDTGRNNQKISWNNPQTGAKGYVIPLNSTTMNGYKCRKLVMYSEARQNTGEVTYLFCKINGVWKVSG